MVFERQRSRHYYFFRFRRILNFFFFFNIFIYLRCLITSSFAKRFLFPVPLPSFFLLFTLMSPVHLLPSIIETNQVRKKIWRRILSDRSRNFFIFQRLAVEYEIQLNFQELIKITVARVIEMDVSAFFLQK